MSEKLTQALMPPFKGQEIWQSTIKDPTIFVGREQSHRLLSRLSQCSMVLGLLFAFGLTAFILEPKLQHLATVLFVSEVVEYRSNLLPIDNTAIVPHIPRNARWTQDGITIAGGHGQGQALNQLFIAGGLYINDDQAAVIADVWNHRIVEWKYGATSGRVLAGGNGPGNRTDQLHFPLDVIVDKKTDSFIICDAANERVMQWSCQWGTRYGEAIIENINCDRLMIDNQGFLYVPDKDRNEVRRYRIGEKRGTLVAGGNGPGDRLNQLNNPRHVFVDQDQTMYVSDVDNHRIMKWMMGVKEGIVVAGGRGNGDGLTQLYYPKGVIVDALGTIYVTDTTNQRVMRWAKDATQGDIVLGGSGEGAQANQFRYPVGLSFDRDNNLYVVDSNNHRIQRFSIEMTNWCLF